MLCAGDVQFIEKDGKTTVLFKLQHQLPNLLVDLQVDTFAVESSCREIFTDNLLRVRCREADARRCCLNTLPRGGGLRDRMTLLQHGCMPTVTK